MSIEGQGHYFTIYFPDFVVLCCTRPRYQVSVYRTIGPLVLDLLWHFAYTESNYRQCNLAGSGGLEDHACCIF